MIVANNGHVMIEGGTLDLLAEFSCVIASIKQMCESHFDEEKALHVIAECGRWGVETKESLDMDKFAKALDEIVSGNLLEGKEN